MWNFQLMSFYVETLTLHRYNNFFSRVYSLTHGFNYGQITPIPWSIHIFIFMCEFSARILRIEFCKNTTDGWLIKQIMWCSHTTVLDPRIKLFLQLYLPCQELGQIMTDAKKMPEPMDWLNTICVITTQYLYSTRCLKMIPNFTCLKQKVLDMHNLEKYIIT